MSPWLQIFFILALFVHILARSNNGENPSGQITTDIGHDDEAGDEETEVGDIEQVTSTRKSKVSLNPKTVLTQAMERTLFEMSVEDLNSEHRIDDDLVRRLIVLPLTKAFNPSQASAMHGKVQYGDKCSLPGSLGKLIFEKPYEVPWLFEVTPVPRNTHLLQKAMREHPGVTLLEQKIDVNELRGGKRMLQKAYISPLDFRAPENYIFLPQWLMQSLNLQSFDLVDVSFVRIKLAGLVVLQPQTLDWDRMMASKDGNLKAVLEHEVNKYSALTAGSTILIEVDGTELPLLVKECRAEGGVQVKGVRIQDSDVKTDIDRSLLDRMLAAIKKKEEDDKLAKEEGRRKLGTE